MVALLPLQVKTEGKSMEHTQGVVMLSPPPKASTDALVKWAVKVAVYGWQSFTREDGRLISRATFSSASRRHRPYRRIATPVPEFLTQSRSTMDATNTALMRM